MRLRRRSLRVVALALIFIVHRGPFARQLAPLARRVVFLLLFFVVVVEVLLFSLLAFLLSQPRHVLLHLRLPLLFLGVVHRSAPVLSTSGGLLARDRLAGLKLGLSNFKLQRRQALRSLPSGLCCFGLLVNVTWAQFSGKIPARSRIVSSSSIFSWSSCRSFLLSSASLRSSATSARKASSAAAALPKEASAPPAIRSTVEDKLS